MKDEQEGGEEERNEAAQGSSLQKCYKDDKPRALLVIRGIVISVNVISRSSPSCILIVRSRANYPPSRSLPRHNAALKLVVMSD